MFAQKEHIFSIFWHNYLFFLAKTYYFSLKLSLSFLAICLLALSVTKSEVYGVLTVVGIAILFHY